MTGVAWATGGTPPMAKPVFSRTNCPSALPSFRPVAASTLAVLTRLLPEAMISTARPLASSRKIRDLAICGTVQPMASAASAAVRVEAGSSLTAKLNPRSLRKS